MIRRHSERKGKNLRIMTYMGFNNLLLRKPHRIFIQIIAENGNCHQSLSSSGGARIFVEDGDTAISLTGDRESDPGVNLSHSKLRGSSNPRQYADGCMARTHRTNQARSWYTPIILGAAWSLSKCCINGC